MSDAQAALSSSAPQEPPPDGNHAAIEARLTAVGDRLRVALGALLDTVPAPKQTPQSLARQLRIHRTLVSRLLNALRTDDPLASVVRMPRSEGLRTIVAAARPMVPRALTGEADAAIAAFEELVRVDLGGWDGLDSVVTEWLPDAREKFELANKQLAFRGMANLTGTRADVQVITSIYYPDSAGRMCDIAIILGMLGLRRLRPSARITFASIGPNPTDPHPLETGPGSIERTGGSAPCPLLRDFCSHPVPRLEAIQAGDNTNYVVAGNDVGPPSSVDLFTASLIRSARPRVAPAGGPLMSGSAGVSVPTRTMLLTLLLHEEVWPGCEPALRVYDTHAHGLASPNDRARDPDIMDVQETVQALGTGASRFRSAEFGRQVELVQHVCGRLGWNADRLRGYRCRVQYPVYSGQYCLVFQPPGSR